jgi:hypothetical protein
MDTITAGKTVRTADKRFGTVVNVGETASGTVATVEYLPNFRHLSPSGGADYRLTDLTEVTVCECAKLGYIGESGEMYTTGCDFSRRPGRNSKFLPGHDAKAKGLLVRAYSVGPMLDGRDALTVARDFGDKITMKVAEGIDKESAREHKKVNARRWQTQVNRPQRAAVREDEQTEAMKLARQLKVTEPMREMLAHALATRDGEVSGPSGTQVALKDRKLTSWGHVTTLGRKVMDYDDLEVEKVVCIDEEGKYTEHMFRWDEAKGDRFCRRCGWQAPEGY